MSLKWFHVVFISLSMLVSLGFGVWGLFNHQIVLGVVSLTASAADTFSLDGGGPQPFLSGYMILELKFRGPMPTVFRQLADTFVLAPGRASKYRTAADILGIARLAPEEGAPYTLHA